MRREVLRRFDQQPGDPIVHLGGLYRGKPEPDLGDGGYEGFEKVAESRLTPGASPGKPETEGFRLLVDPGLAPGVSQVLVDAGLAPGVSRAVLPVRPDMHPREHDLGVVLAERPGLGHELRDRSRAVRAARDGRRAERAMLVAAVLDLEPAARVGVKPPQHGIEMRRRD